MSDLIALPTLAEQRVLEFLQANYQGDYSLNKAYNPEPYSLPQILVVAAKFKQLEPNLPMFQGDLKIAIQTQIDDTANAFETHDATTGNVFGLVTSQALIDDVNSKAGLQISSLWVEGYEMGQEERALVSFLELKINCQLT